MCGICGIAATTLAPDAEATVDRMIARLHHRGPDDRNRVTGQHHVFGHTRLSIIDVAHGQQPMTTADGRFTIVFNGEIYNYRELRDQVRTPLRTNSDTEVLLALLAERGERALDSVEGMFAFAFHDRETQEILLARDPFGIKPLYLATTDDGTLVFASEIKALLEHPQITARRNDAALHEYLTFQFCFGTKTLFAGIEKLDAGCLATWSPDRGVRMRRYWDCDFRIDDAHCGDAFRDELRARLDDAIRIQLRSDVPLGAYLSGGLDSSLVAMLAARELDAPIGVFHGRFAEGDAYDESEYAHAIADATGAAYHEVVPTAADFVNDMPALMEAMDEPTAGPGVFPQYHVSRLAAQHVKVVLGGQGGDELFGGYARYLVGYLEQALKGAIHETQEEGHHLVTLSSIVPNLAVLQQYVPLMKTFWKDGLFEPMDQRYFRLIDRSPTVMGLLTPECAAQRDHDAIVETFRGVFNHPDTKSYINKMTHFDLKTLLPALLQVEDRVSMAASLESRVPLLDRRVARLITTAPPREKFAGGRLKHSLKRIADDVLPPVVAQRKSKMGFPVPLAEWMQTDPVRSFVRDTVLDQTARERGLFDPAAVARLVDESNGFGRALWGVLCLELWHRAYEVAS